MTFDLSEFNSFCREQNMDFEISEGIVAKPFVEKQNRHYFNARRRESRQNSNILSASFVSEYMCDKCNQEPAQTWNDDLGAVCNTCCGPIPNYVEIISDDDINY